MQRKSGGQPPAGEHTRPRVFWTAPSPSSGVTNTLRMEQPSSVYGAVRVSAGAPKQAREGTCAPRVLRLLTLTLTLLLFTPLLAHAGSWAERAAQMNRTEVSAAEAQARGGDADKDARNKICVRSIKPAMPGVDWNTDPTALPYMIYQVGKRTDLPTYLNSGGLDVATDELFEHTIIYLTSHNRWSMNEKETENLARWLERGGTLLLDDCYLRGSPFADSVRPEVAKMIIGSEPRLLLKDDPLVSDTFRMAYPSPWPGEADFENRTWQYFLSSGRPAVFFSPNDDGCGWEISSPPSASNPIGEGIGHGGDNRQREVMYQWITSLLLFCYTH